MGRLIKNHWARLIVMVAAVCQLAAAVECYFWPKIFWDWLTTNLDPAVKPIPILQSVNLVMGFIMLAWEYPLGLIAGSSMHRSLEMRLVALPLVTLASALLYQGSNAALYYFAAMVIYFWAYSEGEIVGAKPWTLPTRASRPGAGRV